VPVLVLMLVPLSLKLVAGLFKAAESAVVLLVCVWLWWCLVMGVVFESVVLLLVCVWLWWCLTMANAADVISVDAVIATTAKTIPIASAFVIFIEAVKL
jgi:hypothetical protein